MDRPHSPQIQSERHLNAVLHYVDLNPVRAGITTRAIDFKWSSYRSHATGQPDALLDPLPECLEIDPKDFRALNRILLKQKKGSKASMYSRTYFIGTPSWIKKRQQEVQRQLSILSIKKQGTIP